MTEFAFSGVGINPHYDTPGNPYDRRLIPGGSSSGAAVSVSDGGAVVAIGTEPERRRYPFRQPIGGKIEVFEDARARPIKIGAVLQQRDPVPMSDADGEECPGEFIHPRLEAGVIETLVTKYQSLSAGRGIRHLID
jgi:hypothetical protein